MRMGRDSSWQKPPVPKMLKKGEREAQGHALPSVRNSTAWSAQFTRWSPAHDMFRWFSHRHALL